MVSFFRYGASIDLKDNQLVKLDKLINWNKIGYRIKGIHKNEEDPQGGQKAYDNLKMFKAIILQNWHNLSDKELEDALNVRIDFMYFTGFDLADDKPDETTICRFRNKLIEKELDKKLFNIINEQLEARGLKMKHAKGAVVDATIIESQARPRRVIEIVEDRNEPEGPKQTVHIEESKDPDATWLNKGKKSFFGYKGFIRTDSEQGFIEAIWVDPAHVSEMKKLPKLLEGVALNKRLLADKGYSSPENYALLETKGIKNGILFRAYRGRPLTVWQKRFNKLISKKRFIVEQAFGTLKRRLKFSRASYITLEKVEAQLYFKATCLNLIKGLNIATA